jgi:hypothetical protein
MAAPIEPSFWQQVLAYSAVSELIALLKMLLKGLLMSAPVTALYRRIWAQSLKLRELIVPWLLLGLFFFFTLVAFTTNNSTITIRNEGNPLQVWPGGLTKLEIEEWAKTLQPYHQKLNSVVMAFGDARNVDFAVTVTQAISEADWPEPSDQSGAMTVGTHIAATKDVWPAAQALQKLIEAKAGAATRLDKIPDKDKTTGKPNVGVIVIYAGLKPQ